MDFARTRSRLSFISACAIGLMVACADRPNEPSDLAQQMEGTWTGMLRQTSCTAGDPRSCGFTFPSTAAFTMRLVVNPDDANVSATFDLTTVPPQGAIAPQRRDLGSLTGSVAADGTLTLEGPVVPDGGAPTATISGWRSHIGPDGSMTGSFTYTQPSGIGTILDPLVVKFDLAGLRRAQ
jgi:hypothetical protein